MVSGLRDLWTGVLGLVWKPQIIGPLLDARFSLHLDEPPYPGWGARRSGPRGAT